MKTLFVLLLSLAIAACTMLLVVLALTRTETLGDGRHGVRFSTLPAVIGGGVDDDRIGPGESVWLYPWERLYSLSTDKHSIRWSGDALNENDYPEIQTRTKEGLPLTVFAWIDFRVRSQQVSYVLSRVAPTDELLREIVAAAAEGEIYNEMNQLNIHELESESARARALEKAAEQLRAIFEPEGISIEKLGYRGHQLKTSS